jgi:class 3 adenylate cyclase
VQREKRKLAAIVAADIAGYSRLVGQDEEAVLRALRAHRRELIDPLIDEHGGRIANTAGDSLLVEFPSAVDALRSVLAIQQGMADRNRHIDADRQIRFRVGINIGDVVAEGDDLMGDGVNVAARLEEISEPGGIYISRSVHEHVAGKFAQVFDDLGHRKVKNIPHLVHVYRVHLADSPSVAGGRGLFERRPVDTTSLVTGRCMCGEICYEINQPVIETGLCHCRMCQRFNSAPFSVWAVFPVEAVRFTRGEPKYYTSSRIGERAFCPNCGSSLAMRYYAPDRSDILAILASTLDHPEDYAPTRHLGMEGKMPWLDMNDSLPRTCSWESSPLRRRWAAVGFPDPVDWNSES